MWKIDQIIALSILTVLSIVDIKIRKVPRFVFILGMAGAAVYQVFCGEKDLWITGAGAVIGGVFFLISKATEEGIGYGDSWAILDLGIYLGAWGVIGVLAGAFGLLFIAGAVVCIQRKTRGTGKITVALPFFPFLAGGYLLMLLGRAA